MCRTAKLVWVRENESNAITKSALLSLPPQLDSQKAHPFCSSPSSSSSSHRSTMVLFFYTKIYYLLLFSSSSPLELSHTSIFSSSPLNQFTLLHLIFFSLCLSLIFLQLCPSLPQNLAIFSYNILPFQLTFFSFSQDTQTVLLHIILPS